MSLISRIVRLFKADFHSMLDQLEEPEALLNQAMREMQDEIASNEGKFKAFENQIDLLNKQQDKLRTEIGELDGRIDICFEEDQEGLAKSLIRKKLGMTRCLTVGEQKQLSLIGQKQDIDKKLEAQKECLTSITDQMRIFTDSESDQTLKDPFSAGQMNSITEAEIEAAFLQEKSRRYNGRSSPQTS